jgi:hypothetical protein
MATNRGTIMVTTVYKRKGGRSYYFKYTDPDGKRRQLSTGRANKRDALLYAQAYVDRLAEQGTRSRTTLSELLKLYEDPATNPRRKEALVAGTNYTMQYALMNARNAKELARLLQATPYLSMQISQLQKRDIKDIASIIVEKHGRRRKSQMLYSTLKVALSQAESDGLVATSPAARLPNIKYIEKRCDALTPTRCNGCWAIPICSPAPSTTHSSPSLPPQA